MLTKEEIKNNINTEWRIPLESQNKSRYGLCKYIIEVCQKLNLSQSTAALSMLITNYFFTKNCIFNYDKLSLVCAALLLSTKTKSSQNRLKDICKEYELHILKALDYNIPDEFPYDFINIYSEILYPNNNEEIANLACKIANDSYFTLANNIYKNYIVALACIYIAAKFLDIPTILDENFKFLDNMKRVNKKKMNEEDFKKELYKYDNNYWVVKNEKNNEMEIDDNDEEYFEKLSLCEKLYPNMKIEDLLDCIKMIIGFYEDMNKPEEDNSKSNN